EVTRRAFAESLAIAALAPVLGVTPGSIPVPDWSSPADSVHAPAGALAKALAGAIRAQYGSRLSAKALTTITDQIQRGLERVERLKKVPLANGDEPDFVFSAPHGRPTR
ncbi:MAG: hypothetical protein ACJ8AY_06440, partial [Gemmatimonadales bacterium]